MTKSVFDHRYDRLRALLIEARRSRDFSQSEVAKKLRRPQSFISKYERGERRLDLIEFLNVTQALRLDPHDILRHIQS